MANPLAGLQVQFADGDRLHVHIVTHFLQQRQSPHRRRTELDWCYLFSLPAFSEDGKKAILYYSATGGFDDSQGAYMIFEKKQVVWTVVDYLVHWIT
jgi:hypothetical protein